MANTERQEISRYCIDLDCVADLEARDFNPEDIRDSKKLWDFFKKSAKLKDNENLSITFNDDHYSSSGFTIQLNAVRLETDEEMEKRIAKELDYDKIEAELKAKEQEAERQIKYNQYLELKKEFESE